MVDIMNLRQIIIAMTFGLALLPCHTEANELLSRRTARMQARLERLQMQDAEELRQKAIAARLQRREDMRIRLELKDDLGDIAVLRNEVVRLVNIERQNIGLQPLQKNDMLEAAAQGHAEDMLSKGYFSHYSRTGDSYADRMQKEDYDLLHAAACRNCTTRVFYGENIAKGHRSPAEVMEGWMNSPPHKKNILSPKYKEIGIGIAGVYWVQNFGAMTIEQR